MLNQILVGLSAQQKLECYTQLGQLALAKYLAKYDVANRSPKFIQHNSGIAYCVDSISGHPEFLLKIHLPAGGNQPTLKNVIQARMAWLEAAAKQTQYPMQAPQRDQANELVTTIDPQELPAFINRSTQTPPVLLHCTLQRWVAGEPPNGDFTQEQVALIGEAMARLHGCSDTIDSAFTEGLPASRADDLEKAVMQLKWAEQSELYSPSQFAILQEAAQKMQESVRLLERTSASWGAIHGDLHHENILFHHNQAYFIDFDSLHKSYFIHDLGVTLYHIYYQPAAIRNALIEAYMSVLDVPSLTPNLLEVFMIWSAITNLAFQVTLPEQRGTKLLVKNLHQLTDEFCSNLIAERPFLLE